MNSRVRTFHRLQSRVERKYKTRWWGRIHTVQPKMLRERFGDGKLLLAVEPLDTRPNYYVLRIDSAWTRENSNEIYEQIDNFYQAIEDEFGPCQCSECRWGRGEEGDGEEEYGEPLPAPSLCLGSSWWWPRY